MAGRMIIVLRPVVQRLTEQDVAFRQVLQKKKTKSTQLITVDFVTYYKSVDNCFSLPKARNRTLDPADFYRERLILRFANKPFKDM